MIETTAKDFAEYIDVNLNTKLESISQSITDLETRLEEFEAMVLLVQQERCDAMGITGSLTDCIDFQPHLTQLCQRIDTVSELVNYLKAHTAQLESKLSIAEEKYGLGDNPGLFRNIFSSTIFKKQADNRGQVEQEAKAPLEDLSLEPFFSKGE